jgi:periplasmic protein TonB
MRLPLFTLLAAGALLCSTLPAAAATPVVAQKVSMAADAKSYRKDGARHLYAAYKDQVYKGKLPPLIHAIVVVEVELDAAGNVIDVNMIRAPSHAPDVTERVRQLIRAASPLPAPKRMGSTKYLDIWLVDQSGRFQLDTLTEGQR